MEKKHADTTARLAAGWDAERNRLRSDAEVVRAGAAARAPVASGLSVDTADNAAISAAVSGFRDEVRAAVDQFIGEAAKQLEQAQLNTDALMRLRAWAVQEQRINQ